MHEIVNIYKTTKQNLSNSIREYYENLIAPMDDMWEEAIIGVSDYYRIDLKNNEVGYFCLDNDNVLLQYYIRNMFIDKSKELLEYIIKEYKINEGFVGTFDTRSFPLFLDLNKEVHTHTYLYKDLRQLDMFSPFGGMDIRKATPSDIHNIIDYYENRVEIQRDWLRPYCTNLIRKQELFLCELNNEIIGTGERRVSESQKGYAHLGVTVAKKYRKKGLASYILSYFKK